ncbi:MAG: hypothetical protein HY054_06495 [Proteobacteria bacterium]|nr:hypothetical protein [Pseudomonadota bacterium]
MGLALNIDELLGKAAPVAPETSLIEAGAVHTNGMVDLARLIPRASAPARAKAQRSILAAPKSRPIS